MKNVEYQIVDDGTRVTLTVLGFSDSFLERILSEGELRFWTEDPLYSLLFARSGANRLETNFGATTVYVSEDGFSEQSFSLLGYDLSDRTDYKNRVSDVFNNANRSNG